MSLITKKALANSLKNSWMKETPELIIGNLEKLITVYMEKVIEKYNQ